MRLVRLSLIVAGLLMPVTPAPAWTIGVYGMCGPRLCRPYVPIVPALGYPMLGYPNVAYQPTFGYMAPAYLATPTAFTAAYSVATVSAPAVGGQAAAQPTFAMQADMTDALTRLRSQLSGLQSDVQQLGRISGTHNDAIADLQRRVDSLERPRSAPTK